jgi:hypothetical protein
MPTYHVFAWFGSLIFAIPTLIFQSAHKFWAINPNSDNTAFCWVESDFHSPYSWTLFYMPLFLIYVSALAILVSSFMRLRHGISRTFIHRLKALIVNTVNVLVSSFYWLLVMFMLGLSKSSGNNMSNGRLYKVTAYFLASKGITCVIVWILTSDVRLDKNDLHDDEGVALNMALRQEVLYYATKGIQSSVDIKYTGYSDQTIVVFKLNKNPELNTQSNTLSPRFFIRLLLGYKEEKEIISHLMEQTEESRQPSKEVQIEMKSKIPKMPKIEERPIVNTLNASPKHFPPSYSSQEDPRRNIRL